MKAPLVLSILFAAVVMAEEPTEGTGAFGAFAASKGWTPPKDPAVLKKLTAWQDQKLGLLITWGTYSQWGIVESWSLVTTRHPWNKRPEKFASLDHRAYMAEYEKLITTFNPVRFNADKWAAAFRDAGVKYVFPMSKHHDGFCMWDTKTTDYKITDPRCPFHKDPRADTIKEMCDSFRKAGLHTGIYFSKADWHHPQYWLPEIGPGPGQGPNYPTRTKPEEWRKFKEFTWQQIEELMTDYGPQDVLWLDGGSVRPPNDIDMDGLAAMTRKHQPGLIVVDRCVRGPNENYITPEGEIPEHYLPYPWETCMTMGTMWPFFPNDQFKSSTTLIRNLCRIVARNGNYLIGIGPDGSGEFPPVVYDRLKEMGEWLKLNGEAIYNTRPVKPYEQADCVFTRARDGTVYAIILTDTLPETITLPAEFTAKAGKAEMLGTGPLAMDANGKIKLPTAAPCQHAWVIRLSARQ